MDSTAKRETQAALKLLNQYAESYKLLETENSNLRIQIKDFNTNITINKEIINSLLSKQKTNKVSSSVLIKLQEENAALINQNSSLSQQMGLFQSQIMVLSQTLANAKEQNDYFKDKIFVLEQAIAQKDNTIKSLSKKKKSNYSQEQTIVIQEPSKAIVHLNDDLLTYKGLYEKLIYYLKSTRENIFKYEEVISELQNENGRLKSQSKLQTLSANRKRENLLSALREQNSPNSMMTDYKSKQSNQRSNSQFIRHQMLQNHSNFEKQIRQKLKIEEKEKEYLTKENNFDNDDFTEILKMAGIGIDTYVNYTKNKIYTKLIDALEFMFKLVLDKTMTISLLETENSNLNQKNYQLNKENMELLNDVKKNKKEMSDSMINNMSQITINNVNINSLNSYQKVLEENRRKREEEHGIKQETNRKNSDETKEVFVFESITSSQFQNEFNMESYSENKDYEINMPSFASIDNDKEFEANIQHSNW